MRHVSYSLKFTGFWRIKFTIPCFSNQDNQGWSVAIVPSPKKLSARDSQYRWNSVLSLFGFRVCFSQKFLFLDRTNARILCVENILLFVNQCYYHLHLRQWVLIMVSPARSTCKSHIGLLLSISFSSRLSIRNQKSSRDHGNSGKKGLFFESNH
jgi:hypothetical protein